jgi:hypothetical protein
MNASGMADLRQSMPDETFDRDWTMKVKRTAMNIG